MKRVPYTYDPWAFGSILERQYVLGAPETLRAASPGRKSILGRMRRLDVLEAVVSVVATEVDQTGYIRVS